MRTRRFTPKVKEEVVGQIIDRGYSVAVVSVRIGVSTHSLLQVGQGSYVRQDRDEAAELREAKIQILRLRVQLLQNQRWRHLAIFPMLSYPISGGM